MLPNNEQLIAAHKANVEALIGLSQKAFEGAEKLVALNLKAARESLADAAELARAAVAAKDAQTLLQLQAEYLQPAAEKAAAYARSVYDVTTELQGEVAEMVESQAGDVQAKMKALVDAAAKNAPAGSENAVSLLKSTFAAANDAMGNASKAAKEAAGVMHANVRQFSAAVSKAKPAAAKGRRSA
jgi:phasin family protein